MRMLVLCACLLGVMGWALAAGTAEATAGKDQPAAMAPMTNPPLRGVVTVPGENGAFSLNLGADDGLHNKAELLIIRDGNVLGKAKVYEIGDLDAQAKMIGDDAKIAPQIGDAVLVQYNPQPKAPCKLMRHITQEPDMSQRRGKFFVALLTLLAIGVTAANSHF